MCGICGEIDFNRGVKAEPIQRMCRVLDYRGPDDEGMVFIKGNECFEMKGPSQSSLGTSRLSGRFRSSAPFHHRSFGGCSSTHVRMRTERSGSSSTERFITSRRYERGWKKRDISLNRNRIRKSSCMPMKNGVLSA